MHCAMFLPLDDQDEYYTFHEEEDDDYVNEEISRTR